MFDPVAGARFSASLDAMAARQRAEVEAMTKKHTTQAETPEPEPEHDAPKAAAIPVPAAKAVSAPEAPILPAYQDRGEGYAVVTLQGIQADNVGQYRVHAPIPQEIDNGGVTYDLHDRAARVYHQRVK